MTHLEGRTWRVVDDAAISQPDEDGVVEVTLPDDARRITVDEQVADGIEEALADDDLELWIGRIDETRFANALSLHDDGSIRLYDNCAHVVWADQIDDFIEDRRSEIDEATAADVVRTLMADPYGDLAADYHDWLRSLDVAT